MAKANKSPIEEKDIRRYLDQNEGFQLEMAAQKACVQNRIRVEHGGSYVDPATDKRRQYDLRAHVARASGCALHLAIECKTLGNEYPLLVSRLPRGDHERNVSFVRTDNHSQSGLRVRIKTRENDIAYYGRGGMVGKAMTRFGVYEDGRGKEEFVTGDADVFEKWSQALGSCHDLVTNAWRDSGESPNGTSFSFVMPILLVSNDSLWVANYDYEGELIDGAAKTDHCQFYVDHSVDFSAPDSNAIRQYPILDLNIFTLKGFSEFILGRNLDDFFDKLFWLPDLRKL